MARQRIASAVFLGLLLVSVPARADVLADLRARLADFAGNTPIQAAVQVRFEGEDEDGETQRGAARLRAERSSAGLALHYSPELLDDISDASDDDDARRETNEALQEIGVAAIDRALHFAPVLAALLEGASVLEEHPASPDAPARLVVRADPSRRKEAPFVKESELQVTIWLDASGLPASVETEHRVRAGRLFINVTNLERHRREIEQVGDRLVVTSAVKRTTVSGLGNRFEREVAMTLQVSAAGGSAGDRE